ncbi:MAG: response regulator transcription factor [Chloroflexota bacterium]|nr:response regulator transcription factor [Chloroflexota bacterium]
MLAARTGDAARAARFLGASGARNFQTGIAQAHWDPDIPSSSVIKSLCDRLGEERFEFLKAEGASLTGVEAVAEAMAYTLPASPAVTGQEPVDPATKHGLSPRELEVLQLMANGLSSQQIADALFLSPRTVTTHITGIFGKLDLSSRTAAVFFAIRSGIA